MSEVYTVVPGTNLPEITVSPAAKQENPQEFPKESTYGKIPAVPVMEAVYGIRFDFNRGLRVLLPENGKEYQVTFYDLDEDVTLYRADVKPGSFLESRKKFYIRFRLIISEKGGGKELFRYDMDLKDQLVMLQLPVDTIGDSIAWFSYAERFQKKHQCRLVCVMTEKIASILRKQYPEMTFITKEETGQYTPYATYCLGLFFHDDTDNQVSDFRFVGLHRTAGAILGLEDLSDIPPRFDLSAPREIKEKYVCIGAHSSSQAKYWNNPFGWMKVVKFLKENGYRVLAIDRSPVYGAGLTWNWIPYGAEDFTGDLPLQERIDLIKDADFFIGLSSGLSWLAWGCGVPVVMISGFTHPFNEFYTPYRITSRHTCNSCWNDMKVEFDHHDFFWCPRHKGTDRQFECTRFISPEQVIHTIQKIPSFRITA